MFQVIKRRLIKLVAKLYDPITTFKIGNNNLKIPLSHPLKEIVKANPEYNLNLPRIIKCISERVHDVKVIDIGANIGDTVAFIKSVVDVPILCIDGDEKYLKMLRENTAAYKNVFSCQSLVGAENGEIKVKLKSDKGTAYIQESNHAIRIRTLESILEEFPEFKNSKIIKSDTDGYDTIILRSCSKYLTVHHPVLFFEFDPHLIKKNNDDAFEFISFLETCGYRYFIFYTNVGDYLMSCTSDQKDTLQQLIHYFSGRKLDLFADVCAFAEADKDIFEKIQRQEIEHFRINRSY